MHSAIATDAGSRLTLRASGRPHRCIEADLACARRCQRRVQTDARRSHRGIAWCTPGLGVISSGANPVYETASLQRTGLLNAQHAVSDRWRQAFHRRAVWRLGGATRPATRFGHANREPLKQAKANGIDFTQHLPCLTSERDHSIRAAIGMTPAQKQAM